jgi:hypothetical protein
MSVEIYHTGHNLIETRAPIRAMSAMNVVSRRPTQ